MRAAPFALASRPARSLGARLASRSTGIKVPFAREQPDEPPLPPDEEPPKKDAQYDRFTHEMDADATHSKEELEQMQADMKNRKPGYPWLFV